MKAFVVALALACAPASRGFDWSAYDDRQTACRLYDRMLAQCSQRGPGCDQSLLHDLQRRCSPPDRK